jgi:competence protein CoiA
VPLIAVIDGVRTRAAKDGPRRAVCTDCGQTMIAKTGEIVIWHWAHLTENPHCAAALETAWHLGWKALATTAGVEVAVGKRRADALTPYGYTIEFQHSALSPEEVRDREKDWGRKLVWIVDAQAAYERGTLAIYAPNVEGGRQRVDWKFAPAWVKAARCWTLLDVGHQERLLFMAEWFSDKPLRGIGWPVTREWVAKYLINGDQLPLPKGIRDWLADKRRQAEEDKRRRAAAEAARPHLEAYQKRQAEIAAKAEEDAARRRQANWANEHAPSDVRQALQRLERGGITIKSTATLYTEPSKPRQRSWRPWTPDFTEQLFECVACAAKVGASADLTHHCYTHAGCGGRFRKVGE